jgi:hypothetical protein
VSRGSFGGAETCSSGIAPTTDASRGTPLLLSTSTDATPLADNPKSNTESNDPEPLQAPTLLRPLTSLKWPYVEQERQHHAPGRRHGYAREEVLGLDWDQEDQDHRA